MYKVDLCSSVKGFSRDVRFSGKQDESVWNV